MPRMTSTRGITGTGFMKCIPMTLSGRRVAAAIFVIEIDDVFDARMHSGLVRRSSFSNSPLFAARFSMIASITISAPAIACMSVVVRILSSAARFSSADTRPLSTPR